MTLKLIRKYTLCMQHICCQESPGERIWSLEKLTTFVFWPVSWSFSNLTVLLTWGRALSNNRKNPGLTAPAWGLTVGLRFSSQYLMAVRLLFEHNTVHGFSRSFLCLSHMLTLNLLPSVKAQGFTNSSILVFNWHSQMPTCATSTGPRHRQLTQGTLNCKGKTLQGSRTPVLKSCCPETFPYVLAATHLKTTSKLLARL